MSVRWITWAWDQECSNAAEKLTLIALADHAGEDGRAFPGCARLAEKTGSGNRTVRRHLDNLETAGLLTRERRRRADGTMGTYTYQLVEDPAANLATGQDDHDQRPPVAGSPAATGGRAEPSSLNRQEPSATARSEDDGAFEVFWGVYGRPGSKQVARKFWNQARKTATASEIQQGLDRWKVYWALPGAAKMKWPQGWLRERRWEATPPPIQLSTATSASSHMDAIRRRLGASA